MIERSRRCVANTARDTRCTRDGHVRVEGGLVCGQHWTAGFFYFVFPVGIAVDPRVAMRAAAVLGDA